MGKFWEILKKIWGFISDPKNQRTVLLIAGAIVILLFIQKCDKVGKLQDKLIIKEQNESYYKDTLIKVYNKNNELQYERAVLIADKKELKEKNKELYDEVKKQRGDVIYLATALAKIKNKEPIIIHTTDTVYPDGSNGLKWDYFKQFDKYNSRTLVGESRFMIDSGKIVKPIITTLLKDEFSLGLTTGLIEEKGQLKIFIKSDYPGFSIANLDGALIDPQKSKVLKAIMPKYRWGIGPTFSVGFMYNPMNKGVGPYIGIGLGITRRTTWQDIKNIF